DYLPAALAGEAGRSRLAARRNSAREEGSARRPSTIKLAEEAPLPRRNLQEGVVEHDPAAGAGGTGGRERLDQAFGDALARHLDQPELGDVEDLRLGLVAGEGLAERPDHLVAVLADLHVDEVDDDDAADVAQAQLAGDLVGRLHVVLEDRLLEARAAHVLAGVDVDDGERLGALDHERAARREPDLAV